MNFLGNRCWPPPKHLFTATMRTTIDLPNGLWEDAKKRAIEKRISLSKLIADALREYLEGGEKLAKS